MTRSLKAIYENGILRPLEPLALEEHQQVTLTVSDQGESDRTDVGFLEYLEDRADDAITIEQVRKAMSKIPGSMAEDFRSERDERS